MLGKNETLFRNAGVFIPKAGRIELSSAAHHNVAWELGRDERYDRTLGTFETLLQEAAAADAPNICLTSEDFERVFSEYNLFRYLEQPELVALLLPAAIA